MLSECIGKALALDPADRFETAKAMREALGAPRPIAAVRAAPSLDHVEALLGADADAGTKALRVLLEYDDLPVRELLGSLDWNWPRTRVEQALHRMKQLFAASPERHAPALSEAVLDGSRDGEVAAICFDLFPRDLVAVETANRVAAAIKPRYEGELLARVDVARNAIAALGYLGASSWAYRIREALESSREDQRLGRWGLSALLRLNGKTPARDRGIGLALSEILRPFLSGAYHADDGIGGRKSYFEDAEMAHAKRVLREQKGFERADDYVRQLAGIASGAVASGAVASGAVASGAASTYAGELLLHMLGSFGLERLVQPIAAVLGDDAPAVMRAEAAVALCRISSPKSASTLRDAYARVDPESRLGFQIRYALVLAAPDGDAPERDLETGFEGRSRWYRLSEWVRAAGLAKARKRLPAIEAALDEPYAAIRGAAGLAVARLEGRSKLPLLERRLAESTAGIEHALLSLAVLEAGGRPDPDAIRRSLDLEALEWDPFVRRDIATALGRAGPPYDEILRLWEPMFAAIPASMPLAFNQLFELRGTPR